MNAIQRAADRRERQGRQRYRVWRGSTMDCGDEGCGYCRVCRHYDFQDYVRAVAPRDVPCSVSYDQDVVRYLNSSK